MFPIHSFFDSRFVFDKDKRTSYNANKAWMEKKITASLWWMKINRERFNKAEDYKFRCIMSLRSKSHAHGSLFYLWFVGFGCLLQGYWKCTKKIHLCFFLRSVKLERLNGCFWNVTDAGGGNFGQEVNERWRWIWLIFVIRDLWGFLEKIGRNLCKIQF